jgi:uncharacterized protein (DUF433 family)
MTNHSIKPWKCLKCKPEIKIKNHTCKITPQMATEILERKLAGETTRELAKAYNVSVQTIQDHIRGFTATKSMITKWIDERIEYHKTKAL